MSAWQIGDLETWQQAQCKIAHRLEANLEAAIDQKRWNAGVGKLIAQRKRWQAVPNDADHSRNVACVRLGAEAVANCRLEATAMAGMKCLPTQRLYAVCCETGAACLVVGKRLAARLFGEHYGALYDYLMTAEAQEAFFAARKSIHICLAFGGTHPDVAVKENLPRVILSIYPQLLAQLMSLGSLEAAPKDPPARLRLTVKAGEVKPPPSRPGLGKAFPSA
ncbi:hypothetical protein [Sinorhizobium fredii]|uniref:hypothetical protein n=1 Tax=Rhizobium fredii TaxID=380 RepID=UPI003394AFFD